jgi:sugar/nucleoside kinase (ribokinase family)
VPQLALVGNLSRDHVDGRPPRIGGGTYHGAHAWRNVALRSTIVARCGPDEREAFTRRLSAVGLPVMMLRGKATAEFAFHYEGETRVMTVETIGDTWAPEDVETVAPGAWVHVAALLRSDFPAETLSALARRRRLSFDGQGLVRLPQRGPLELDGDFDRALLRHVQILKLAEEEAEVVGAVDKLGVPEVLVTYAERGCTVYADGREHFVAARPIATDPTGSGDVFSAAYLAARAQGLGPVSAARRATAVVAELLTARAR